MGYIWAFVFVFIVKFCLAFLSPFCCTSKGLNHDFLFKKLGWAKGSLTHWRWGEGMQAPIQPIQIQPRTQARCRWEGESLVTPDWQTAQCAMALSQAPCIIACKMTLDDIISGWGLMQKMTMM